MIVPKVSFFLRDHEGECVMNLDFTGSTLFLVLLLFAAGILGPIGGKKVGIHPARVRKLMVSTNVCGRKLAATDYRFHYTLEESFRDWFEDCDRKELV